MPKGASNDHIEKKAVRHIASGPVLPKKQQLSIQVLVESLQTIVLQDLTDDKAALV